jgi:hypothetical protein
VPSKIVWFSVSGLLDATPCRCVRVTWSFANGRFRLVSWFPPVSRSKTRDEAESSHFDFATSLYALEASRDALITRTWSCSGRDLVAISRCSAEAGRLHAHSFAGWVTRAVHLGERTHDQDGCLRCSERVDARDVSVGHLLRQIPRGPHDPTELGV